MQIMYDIREKINRGGGIEPTLGKRWPPLETHEKKVGGVDF